MRWATILRRRRNLAPMLLTVLLVYAKSTPCAVVSETEAIAVADLWYAMELNSGMAKMEQTERQDRLAQIGARDVAYLVSGGELLDHRPDSGVTLAYVVTYKPTGFVVVAGEDRLQPIVVFNARSTFRWDHPEVNFLRYFLGREMPKRWLSLRGGVHPVWSNLRSRLSERPDQATFTQTEREGYTLWDTAPWDQGWPYDLEVVAQNGGIEGIPTGCTATAMAIKMRFHSWPPTGAVFHGYTDDEGDVQFSHFVNFGTHTYDWQSMPDTALTTVSDDVIALMYHCGVAVDMNYEVGASGAWPTAFSMDTYFRYKGTMETAIDLIIRESILGGLPVVCSSTNHTVLADGYRDTVAPFFHLNCGWSGAGNAWYDLYTDFPGDDSTIDQAYPYCSPENYIYVDANSSEVPDGTIRNPFQSLPMGLAVVEAEGHLWIRTATYPGPVVVDKPISIRSYVGTTIVGENLSLSPSGFIRTHDAGEIRIY